MRSKWLLLLMVLGLLTLVTVAAGCPAQETDTAPPAAEDVDDEAGEEAEEAAEEAAEDEEAAEADGPEIAFTTPEDGATVTGTEVSAAVEVQNFTLAADKINQPDEPGEGHIHYWLNGERTAATADTETTFTGLTPGEHKLKASLQTNSHLELDPPIEQEITITVQ